MPPDILHRYLGSHALETLEKKRLMTGKVSRFNDPFELCFSPPRSCSAEDYRRVIRDRRVDPEFEKRLFDADPNSRPEDWIARFENPETLKRIQERLPQFGDHFIAEFLKVAEDSLRVVSFAQPSTAEAELLMWSHYANKHAGWRIWFQFPHSTSHAYELQVVEYAPERVPVPLKFDEFSLQKALRTKCKAWAYEKEVRLLANPRNLVSDILDTGELAHFLSFGSSNVLRVDLGLRSDANTNAKLIDLVHSKFPQAQVFKARMHPSYFDLCYDQLI